VTGSVAIGPTCLDDCVTMSRITLTILLLAAAIAATGPVDAGQRRDPAVTAPVIVEARDDRDLVITQSNGPSLSEAVEMVRRQYKGRIISAETKTSGNCERHHIKVLTEDGTVKTVRIQGRCRER
jgi:hypothetical protein